MKAGIKPASPAVPGPVLPSTSLQQGQDTLSPALPAQPGLGFSTANSLLLFFSLAKCPRVPSAQLRGAVTPGTGVCHQGAARGAHQPGTGTVTPASSRAGTCSRQGWVNNAGASPPIPPSQKTPQVVKFIFNPTERKTEKCLKCGVLNTFTLPFFNLKLLLNEHVDRFPP